MEIEEQVGGLWTLLGASLGPCSVSRGVDAQLPDLLIPVRLRQVLASLQHVQEVTFKLSEGDVAYKACLCPRTRWEEETNV